MLKPGILLEDLLVNARKSVLIASPFIKRRPFDRLLTKIPIEIPVNFVTRWRVDEIAGGISDPSIWEAIKERGNGNLFLLSNLHAKYYRVDENCLIGSANLTDKGLGWHLQSNIELLVRPEDSVLLSQDFESYLLQKAILVDEMMYQHALQFVGSELGIDEEASLPSNAIEEPVAYYEAEEHWLPETRHPENLYDTYAEDWMDLSVAARASAERDLRHFIIETGMVKKNFNAEVGIQLLEKPVIRRIDRYLTQPRRFGEVVKLLSSEKNMKVDPSEAWQTTMRWLRFFLPHRYLLAIPGHTEIMCRIDSTSAQPK